MIIGSMAVREREGLEYIARDSYLVTRRCAACQLQAPTMGESVYV